MERVLDKIVESVLDVEGLEELKGSLGWTKYVKRIINERQVKFEFSPDWESTQYCQSPKIVVGLKVNGDLYISVGGICNMKRFDWKIAFVIFIGLE